MAGDKAATLDVFKKAQTVKINPDKPQEQCRFLTLEVRPGDVCLFFFLIIIPFPDNTRSSNGIV